MVPPLVLITIIGRCENSKIVFYTNGENESENHKKMSYDALTNLNLIYLYFSNKFQDQKNNFYFFDYDLDNNLLGFFIPENILKLDIYNLLMQSTNSQHALGISNRKFYWNSIENYFEPIVYDSNIDINRSTPTTTTALFRLPISKQFFIDIFRVPIDWFILFAISSYKNSPTYISPALIPLCPQ